MSPAGSRPGLGPVQNPVRGLLDVLAAALSLAATLHLWDASAHWPLGRLALGVLIHAVGLVVFVNERPRLWPRWFSFHELFHLLPLGGGAVNYTLLLRLLSKAG